MSGMSAGVMKTLFPEDFASLKANSAALSVRSAMSDERWTPSPYMALVRRWAAKGINCGKRLLTISVFLGGENGDIGLEKAYFWKPNVQ